MTMCGLSVLHDNCRAVDGQGVHGGCLDHVLTQQHTQWSSCAYLFTPGNNCGAINGARDGVRAHTVRAGKRCCSTCMCVEKTMCVLCVYWSVLWSTQCVCATVCAKMMSASVFECVFAVINGTRHPSTVTPLNKETNTQTATQLCMHTLQDPFTTHSYHDTLLNAAI